MGERRVVVIGETAVDVLVACGADEPVWGQVEREIGDARLVMGSSGAITAAALAALGVAVSFVGVVGDDHLGRFFHDELVRHGVDVSALRVMPSERTGITVALERDGDRAMLTYPGTMARLSADQVPAELIDNAAHVHVSSYFLQRGLREGLAPLFASARDSGATTSLDPGWDSDGTWDGGLSEVLGHVNWFLPNEAEARAIAAQLVKHSAFKRVGALVILRAYGMEMVAVKRAGAGADLAHGSERLSLNTVPLIPLDTTGAGDNFNAGFIAGMLDGDPREALALGVACGRHSILGRGGTGSLATRDDVADVVHHLLENMDAQQLITELPNDVTAMTSSPPEEER